MAFSPDEPKLRRHLIPTLLAAGDQEAALRARTEMLDRFGATPDADNANEIERAAALMTGAVDRLDLSVQLGERAVDSATDSQRESYSTTLGAALYRAGRLEPAIGRLKQGIGPVAWTLLSLAHYRLGHRDDARGWLRPIQTRIVEPDPSALWAELEIRVLRSEAEAVILYDPILPADPFAH